MVTTRRFRVEHTIGRADAVLVIAGMLQLGHAAPKTRKEFYTRLRWRLKLDGYHARDVHARPEDLALARQLVWGFW